MSNNKATTYRWPTPEELVLIRKYAAEVKMNELCLWCHYLDCQAEREQHAAEHCEQIEDESFQDFITSYKESGVWDDMLAEASAR